MKRVIGEGVGTPEACWLSWPGLNAIENAAAQSLVPIGKRLVVIAPHPDDEILMAGGLIQHLFDGRDSRLVIAVTDGDASHPGSTLWPPERLRDMRPQESTAALATLQAGVISVMRLGLPDGQLRENAAVLSEKLAAIITVNDVVLATWTLDGHPDHEVCGGIAKSVVQQCGATFIEVPVWMWHWATPEDDKVPWQRARRLYLTAQQVARKKAAMSCFVSQLGADIEAGREAVVTPTMLARVERNYEVFFI